MGASQRWTVEVIKEGIEKFQKETGHLPTARDFDAVEYLPSARQIQRLHGGLPALRLTLGIDQLDYTKGDLRRAIAKKGYSDGLSAEERLEVLLVKKFGEPYVHTQKRYGMHLKNRYDFFVYCKNECFAVDVFMTGRPEYIATNIRHKISKYKELGPFKIYFVAAGEFNEDDITRAIKSLPILNNLQNIVIASEEQFLREVAEREPLEIPSYFQSSF